MVLLKPNYSNYIHRRLSCINLPLDLKVEVTNLFQKWVSCNGPEWAVERMKTIKTGLLFSYQHGVLPEVGWIAKSDPATFSGPFGRLQRLFESQGKKTKKAVLTLLQVYTVCVDVSKDPSSKSEEKFLGSMTREKQPIPEHYHRMMVKAGQKHRMYTKFNLDMIDDAVLTLPKGNRWYEEDLVRSYRHFASHSEGAMFLHRHAELVNRGMGSVNPSSRTAYRRKDVIPKYDVFGEIRWTQEPGLKVRFYADPKAWVQNILEPLKGVLMQHLKMLEYDGTHDQTLAHPHIVEALAKGRTVHCFDLSDATNVFPLELQMTYLRSVLHQSWTPLLGFFEEVCKGHWLYKDTRVCWTRGQPLGLGPSFASFASTHGALLYSLNGFRHDDNFFIIGDDVIILDDSLASRYQKALGDLDLPWSAAKSMQSNKIAEFAGHVFLPDGIFQSLKWKPITLNNVLDMIRGWGPKVADGFFKRNRKRERFVKWVLSLPEPYGLGLNPLGLSLDSRLTERVISKLLEIEEREDKVTPRSIQQAKIAAARMNASPALVVQKIGSTELPKQTQQELITLKMYDQYIQTVKRRRFDEITTLPPGFFTEVGDWPSFLGRSQGVSHLVPIQKRIKYRFKPYTPLHSVERNFFQIWVDEFASIQPTSRC